MVFVDLDQPPTPPPLPSQQDMFHFVPIPPPIPDNIFTAVRDQVAKTDELIVIPGLMLEQTQRNKLVPLPTPTAVVSQPSSQITDPTIGFCCICYLECEWHCVCGQAACDSCMKQFILSRMQDRTFEIPCPNSCGAILSRESLSRFLSSEEMEKYDKTEQMHRNPYLRECPSCKSLVEGSEVRPNLTCSQCNQEFCFYHELAHVGEKCNMKIPSAWSRARTSAWTWIHTRKCPKCSHHIQKNGGCPHMTCRCGHEICWMCGGNWIFPDGHRGHEYSPFPRPSNFKYSCQGWRAWGLRVGIVVGAVPAGALFFTVALPGYYAFNFARKAWRAHQYRRSIIREAEARRRQQEERVKRSKKALLKKELGPSTSPFTTEQSRDMCAGYYNSIGEASQCKGCSGQIPCVHVYPTDERDPFLCVICGHWELHDDACAHFFYKGAPCTFCHLTQDEVRVRTEKKALDAAMDAAMSEIQEMISMDRPPTFASPLMENGPLDTLSDNCNATVADFITQFVSIETGDGAVETLI